MSGIMCRPQISFVNASLTYLVWRTQYFCRPGVCVVPSQSIPSLGMKLFAPESHCVLRVWWAREVIGRYGIGHRRRSRSVLIRRRCSIASSTLLIRTTLPSGSHRADFERGGGAVWPLDQLQSVARTAQELDLAVHMDGAHVSLTPPSSPERPSQITL